MKQQFLSLDIPLPAMPLLGTGHSLWDAKPIEPFIPGGQDEPEITTWFLDTRELWPGENILTAQGAAEALSLVSLAEQKIITTK
ncbi:hypothetical protein LTR53_020534, partial [Teratosphaeriaceae sp. CCFEE 6253]